MAVGDEETVVRFENVEEVPVYIGGRNAVWELLGRPVSEADERRLSDDDPDRKGFVGLDVARDGSTALVGVPGDYPGELEDTGSAFAYDGVSVRRYGR